jgi:hypothetical protein
MKRARYFVTVLASTWNLSAAASIIQPSLITNSTILWRHRGVSAAFGWIALERQWLPGPISLEQR